MSATQEAYRRGIKDALAGVRAEVEGLRNKGSLTPHTEDAMTRAMVFANAEALENHFYAMILEEAAA